MIRPKIATFSRRRKRTTSSMDISARRLASVPVASLFLVDPLPLWTMRRSDCLCVKHEGVFHAGYVEEEIASPTGHLVGLNPSIELPPWVTEDDTRQLVKLQPAKVLRYKFPEVVPSRSPLTEWPRRGRSLWWPMSARWLFSD